jgi:hypothetical protein
MSRCLLDQSPAAAVRHPLGIILVGIWGDNGRSAILLDGSAMCQTYALTAAVR